MSDTVRYFKLAEDIGLEPAVMPDPKNPGEFIPHPRAGEPGPLVAFKITIAKPAMAGKEVIDVAQELDLPDPRYAVIADKDERVFKVHDPIVANAFAEHSAWREQEPPKADQPRRTRTSAASEE